MPEPINRSTASQIASYCPPEPLVSQAPAAPATPSAAVVPTHVDLAAVAPVLERSGA